MTKRRATYRAVERPFKLPSYGLGLGVGRPADRSLMDGGCWQTATFTVPANVPHERVVAPLIADKYQRRFGSYLESVGFQVLYMGDPTVDAGVLSREPDRRRYTIRAWCKRRPITTTLTVPDCAVPEMLKRGLTLARKGN